MSSTPFCHLHFHTCYSLLDSTAKVKPSVKAAADMGMQYLAMTDHAVLFGAVEFYKTCFSSGLKPIIGVLVTSSYFHVRIKRIPVRGLKPVQQMFSLLQRAVRIKRIPVRGLKPEW